jgi:hypothetical protein
VVDGAADDVGIGNVGRREGSEPLTHLFRACFVERVDLAACAARALAS